MPKLLQINVTANWGSTGKIAEQIGLCAQTHGWESYIAYGRSINLSKNHLIKIGSMIDVYEHYAENKFLNNEGLASRKATKTFLKEVDALKPDVVHLQNIHDHYINYRILFNYLAERKIPVVWTQHDVWATTGHCAVHLDSCEKWEYGCSNCPAIHRFCLDRSKRNYKLKKTYFTSLERMIIVPVSEWLGSQIQLSFLNKYPMKVIKNGVDVASFQPVESNMAKKYDIIGRHILLGVANVWNAEKGLDDYVKLSSILPEDYVIVLVGVTQEQQKNLPANIVGVRRTHDQYELIQLYSLADILLSLSKGETFGMTMAEAYACGTPCIVYDNTAQPEIVTPKTGRVVRTGDIFALSDTIKEMIGSNFKAQHTIDCRKRAEEQFDKDKCFEKYIKLYEQLINDEI